MSRQILDVAKAVSCEMQVSDDVIFEAIEAALESAIRKRHFKDIDVKVRIDRKTGDYKTYRCWTVLDEKQPDFQEIFNADRHLTLLQAKEKDEALKVGDVIEELMASEDIGRIGVQTAKQVILQKVREAKRAQVANAYRDKVGQLIHGVVKRVAREGIALDLGDNAEVFIPRSEMIPGEMVHVNDRLRAYLSEIKTDSRGPQLMASRSREEVLKELLTIEVPEIGDGVIEIKALARDPGLRSKVSVKTNDGRIDPIGACVGMRGSRIQVISNELNGERIDIILWDDNPAQLVINAMTPAEVASIVMDEDSHTMDIAVEESQLSQAIGRNGQNVRLASQLTGWKLNVMSLQDAENKQQVETEKFQQLFMEKLDVDAEVALILVREGFTSIEEIAYIPKQELLNVAEFDDGIIEALRQRAKTALENEKNHPSPAEDLLNLAGMNRELAYTLAAAGIKTREELAEQSVDELIEVKGVTTERARELIMAARAHWFNEE
ncbi:MAG: transcription termination/antitermination protein NusA [Gammaproteobacteria bacterium GWE2_42_36]|nr:MAG: transcription termination/antitermination protein NusA [Gammaproteobacteria bacterium GWE2_42_36]HCU05756.1 transcription termination/antitermination protein NusA [Coxiellaceae bacterium]